MTVTYLEQKQTSFREIHKYLLGKYYHYKFSGTGNVFVRFKVVKQILLVCLLYSI